MNVAFIIDGSDSITGRPHGGQWKQVKQWVWNVIAALDLESRPAVSYVSVMQVKPSQNLKFFITSSLVCVPDRVTGSEVVARWLRPVQGDDRRLSPRVDE